MPLAREERFDAVVRDYGAAIARVARGYEADADRQRDLVQEIFVAVWRALPSFAERSSLRTWVFRVAHNVAVTHVRAAAIAGRLATLEEIEGGDGAAIIEARNEVQRLAALVRKLRPIDRQVILLHLEGFTPPEIAEIIGITSDHASVKVHRIKTVLRSAMTKGEKS